MGVNIFTFYIVTSAVFSISSASFPANSPTLLGSVDGKTYFVATEYNQPWAHAHTYCEKLGMHIATIKSEAQAEFLKSAFKPFHFKGWFWLGARTLNRNERFKWDGDGDEVQMFSSIKWMSGAGEDENDGVRHHQCLCFHSNNHAARSWHYFKRPCNHPYYTLCERETPIEITTSEPSQLINIGSFESKSYFGDKILRTWRESNEFCQNNGLNLASLTIKARLRFLKSACSKINQDGWFWVDGDGTDNDYDLRYCSCFIPHDNLHFLEACNNKHFTLCEAVNDSVTLGSNLKELEQSTVHVDLGLGHPTNYTADFERVSNSSVALVLFIFAIVFLVIIIIGLLNNPSRYYLPIVEYFKYEDVSKGLPSISENIGLNEKF